MRMVVDDFLLPISFFLLRDFNVCLLYMSIKPVQPARGMWANDCGHSARVNSHALLRLPIVSSRRVLVTAILGSRCFPPIRFQISA